MSTYKLTPNLTQAFDSKQIKNFTSKMLDKTTFDTMKTVAKWIISLLIFSISFSLSAQINYNKEAFRFYNNKGKVVNYQDLYEVCLKADIVLFGELHNNTIIHWLQLELAQDLIKDSTKKLVMGAEMFEQHQKIELMEYLQGVSDYKTLKKDTKLWLNFKTDYKPLVDAAKDNNVEFVATNIPRTFARSVARMGLDSFYTTLNDSVRQLMAPMPMPLDFKAPGYKELIESNFGAEHGLRPKRMVQAQAIKDATMAYFITQNLSEEQRFLHFNGAFHSNDFGGIVWYLKNYDKKKKVLVISSVESGTLEFNSEWKNQGDFILVVPENMAKSY